jgi:hypothetical protein
VSGASGPTGATPGVEERPAASNAAPSGVAGVDEARPSKL